VTAGALFLSNGGDVATLAKLANAAYDIAADERIIADVNEGTYTESTSHKALAASGRR
jgi:hypothetical protein